MANGQTLPATSTGKAGQACARRLTATHFSVRRRSAGELYLRTAFFGYFLNDVPEGFMKSLQAFLIFTLDEDLRGRHMAGHGMRKAAP